MRVQDQKVAFGPHLKWALIREYKKSHMVLTLGLGQSGQPEAKMPKNMPTLSQSAQQYSNPRSKFSTIF
jgi:hypothetical protein